MKVFLRWLLGSVGYILLIPTAPVAAIFISIFTRPMPHKLPEGYSWGSIWGTYDNPPQGDEGYVSERCFFPNEVTGWKGYINRVWWIGVRNILYGWKKMFMVPFKSCTTRKFSGNPNISDKYKVPGWLLVRAYCHKGDLQAFEFYGVFPYSKTRNLRMRLGWKIKGDKFDEVGEYAALVFTINPFDGYGDEKKKE